MTSKAFERKLTAILSADVAGYSRLMRDNEASTVDTITAYREMRDFFDLQDDVTKKILVSLQVELNHDK